MIAGIRCRNRVAENVLLCMHNLKNDHAPWNGKRIHETSPEQRGGNAVHCPVFSHVITACPISV